MKRLTKQQIISFHEAQINRFGGLHGLRDENALDSALNSAFQSFDGKDLYKTNIDKIAAVCYSLIANHAFVDGNKRIGIHAMLVMLAINNIGLRYTQAELTKLGLNVAGGNFKQGDVKRWINQHIEY